VYLRSKIDGESDLTRCCRRNWFRAALILTEVPKCALFGAVFPTPSTRANVQQGDNAGLLIEGGKQKKLTNPASIEASVRPA
jgi:hypothetical protein